MGYIAGRDTRSALELFNRLYTDGKDIAAILDELACLTRDLLVMKIAAGVGITMLSGVASEQEVAGLLKQVSSGELVRMMGLIQTTAAGFSKSSNRRMDAELCIVNLCQPELQLDAESLNARLTRLEEQIRSGSIVVSGTAPAAAKQEQEEDDRPPVPDDSEAPPSEDDPAPEPRQQPQAPVGFWTDLVTSVGKELLPPAKGFFVASQASPLRGALKGDVLYLLCDNSFVAETVNKPRILETVGRKASAMLGRPVQVRVTDRSAKPQKSPKLEQLVNFGKSHSDVINIKE